MNRQKHDEHGSRCSCRGLADALSCPPNTVRFSYCHGVLIKHWAIECNHGCHDEPAPSASGSKWHDIGPIDPIKAILIKNE